jgi:hypothetical protein
MGSEDVSFSIEMLEKYSKKEKDELHQKGCKIISVIRQLRLIYNVVVRDENG